MERELRLTKDGSHTLYVLGLDEPYHSMHGAIQESMHVFINQGFQIIRKSSLTILEIGMGTGLNVMLSLVESIKHKTEVYYHAVEKYPLSTLEYNQLNYETLISDIPKGSLFQLHTSTWETKFSLADNFMVKKELSDIRSMNPKRHFDLVYFDAFAPEKQPKLWTKEIFRKLSLLMNPGGILVSYTSKSAVRRALNSSGFAVTKVPGPPGKWEMIRAIRI